MTRCVLRKRETSDNGISLILVMLAILVLSALAATIVFTARSETFASYSYKVDTAADYLAKAGVQAGVNWFRSNHYLALSNTQAPNYYNVTSDGSIFNLYSSNTNPVNCVHVSSSKCNVTGAPVKLITYGSGSSNYPKDISNTQTPTPVLVPTAFKNDLQNLQITGDANNTGYVCVNAYLLSYQTVNCLTCAVNPAPMETWLITSQASWGGTSCTSTSLSGGLATAEEQAVIQPIYQSDWGNALYGYCSVSMSGSSGTCTDAFNSALGSYGGGNASVAAGACNSSSTNVISSGAGVGANGYVNLSSNVSVAGNVSLGNVGYVPPSSCCTGAACGYLGSTSSVQGAVINAPPVPVPSVPSIPGSGQVGITFPTGPPAAPSYSSTQSVPAPTSALSCPGSVGCPASGSSINAGAGNGLTWPCIVGTTCTGTAANPYLITDVSLSGSGTTLTLFGGPDYAHPVYYDLSTINESGTGAITISGYVVLNVKTSVSITGQGITNAMNSNQPPEALQINTACSGSCVSMGGNGGMSAIVTAPNATVTVGGGGSKGYMVGAIRSANVSVMGGYPVHYDLQLNRLQGVMGQTVISSYTRIKQ
jgi:hypothetical protein